MFPLFTRSYSNYSNNPLVFSNQKTKTMKPNPYHKNCPHCQKDFNARRLNQKYCTYFCKVQFNNNLAKMRRLDLLEIAKKYQSTISQNPPIEEADQTTLPPSVPQNLIENNKPNLASTLNGKAFKYLKKIPSRVISLFSIGAIIYLLYSFFKQKNKDASPSEVFANNGNVQNIPSPPIESTSTSPFTTPIPPFQEKDNVSPIPIEIYYTQTDSNSSDPNLSPNFKNYQNHLQEEHPDVSSINRILKDHKKI